MVHFDMIPSGAYNIKIEIAKNSLSKIFPSQICEFFYAAIPTIY